MSTIEYTVYTPETGEIQRTGTCNEVDLSAQAEGGLQVIEGRYSSEDYYIFNDGPPAAYSASQKAIKALIPNYPSKWSNHTMQWTDLQTLQYRKDSKWYSIKQLRTTQIDSLLNTPYGIFDADPKSQKSITDAIMMLQTLESLGTPTTIDFTLADNSTVTLTTAQMVAVGLLLGSRTQQAYAHARDLKVLINAATTKEEVDAITW